MSIADRPRYYVLEGREIKPCSVLEWGKMFEDIENRLISRTAIGNNSGVEVSTVFLGLDHGWFKDKPVLFETMIFGGEHDQYQDRYCTYDEAEAGHTRVVENLFQGRDPDEGRDNEQQSDG